MREPNFSSKWFLKIEKTIKSKFEHSDGQTFRSENNNFFNFEKVHPKVDYVLNSKWTARNLSIEQ